MWTDIQADSSTFLIPETYGDFRFQTHDFPPWIRHVPLSIDNCYVQISDALPLNSVTQLEIIRILTDDNWGPESRRYVSLATRIFRLSCHSKNARLVIWVNTLALILLASSRENTLDELIRAVWPSLYVFYRQKDIPKDKKNYLRWYLLWIDSKGRCDIPVKNLVNQLDSKNPNIAILRRKIEHHTISLHGSRPYIVDEISDDKKITNIHTAMLSAIDAALEYNSKIL